MSSLAVAVAGFIEAAGFALAGRSQRGVLGERVRAIGGAPERLAVWSCEPDATGRYDEAALLAEIDGELAAAPEKVPAFLVVPTLAGLSVPFKDRLAKAGVAIRVPVQFFDTPYKADGDTAFGTGSGDEARSVFAEFVADTAEMTAARVPQPFVALSALGDADGGFAAGDDLLQRLLADLSSHPDGPCLTIVMGHAGAGKSVLFASLFAALHQRFAVEKRAQRSAVRPILFLPAHIRDRQVRTLDGLLDAVARTDAAAATHPRLMRWLNSNGMTSWMFDGLDEFFAGEGDFLGALDAILTGAGKAQILICTRDSLLASSTGLRDLVDRHLPSGRVRLYELARWDRPAQQALATLRLDGRSALATPGAAASPDVARFLATLDQSPALAELATLPFYCNLLLGLHRAGRAAPTDEFELLQAAVDGLIDREAEKLSGGELGFGWDVFSGADTFVDASEMVDTLGAGTFNEHEDRERLLAAFHAIGRERLIELIEGIAHMARTAEAYPNESRGLPIEDVAEIGRYYLDVGLMPELEPRVLLALVQFAFFAPGRDQGHIRFAHEIIADYLAARCAVAMVRSRPDTPDAVSQALGNRADLAHSVFLRYLVHELLADPDLAGAVRAHAASGRIRPQAQAGATLLADALARGRA
ncbi:MAG: hypothetical protein ACKVP7_22425 [Hyphomicrobiaceae bacterium]